VRNLLKSLFHFSLNHYDKFKEKWNNDLMLNDHSKLRTYRFPKNEYGKEENYLLKNIPLKKETGRY
jgi:hypothetical protein